MRSLGALPILLLFAPGAAAQEVRVDASVNAERIGVEDVLELTIAISGGEPESEPELSSIPGFRVAGRSTSSQIQIVNGRMSSTRSYIYQLLPQSEGEFTLGEVEVEVGGRTYRTQPIAVEVVPGSIVARRPRGFRSPFDPFDGFGSRGRDLQIEQDDVFVRAEVSKRSVFQGEQIVVTYRLYSRYVPMGPEIEDDPPLTGFWVEEVDLGREPTAERRTVDGREYFTFPLKQRVVFPTSSGAATIPPMTFAMAFRVSSGDPFDAFFARASSPITLRSSPVEIQVAPLPAEGRGRAFQGAVGQYELEAKLDKEEVGAGDPVTLTLEISGKGNLRSVEAPELPELKGFRAFAPKAEERARAGASGLEGTKTWEYVLVPESGGVKELGPWRFQYFDPAEKKYVTASVGPLDIRVTGDVASGGSGSSNLRARRGEITLLRDDVRFLKEAPDRLGAAARPFHRSPLFYASLLLPMLWNAGLLVYLRRREKEKSHSSLFRSRRAHRMARERLKNSARLLDEGGKGFYDEIAAALYRYVADKCSSSPSGLTSNAIEEILEARSVTESLRREFLDLLSKCEEARFTPGGRSREEMASLRERAEELIVAVERSWSR